MVATAHRGPRVNALPGAVADLAVLESPVFGDDRGLFREWFRASALGADAGFRVAQANLSVSAHNVVRGLHYSLADEGQAKLVTCAQGAVDDVIVDIRLGSPTFGALAVVPLAAEAGRSVYLPAGVAHGFVVRSASATLVYLLSSPYNAAVELEIDPFDPEIGVPWDLDGEPVLSAKDAAAPTLAQRRAAGQLPTYGGAPGR